MTDWIAALGAERGLVALAGAGGKKTALQRIAREHPGRVAATATTFTASLTAIGDDVRNVEDTGEGTPLPAAALDSEARRTCLLGAATKPGRRDPLSPGRVAALHREGGFDATLVKADGARMRGLKAPREGEPVLPPGTETVIGLMAIPVLGAPLDGDHAHRVERLAAVTGLEPGAALTVEALARVIAHPQGLFRDCNGARRVAVINQVDDAARREQAEAVAQRALALGAPVERVVLTCLIAAEPVVAVVEGAGR